VTSAELFDALATATSAGSIAILVVLVLRAPLRRWLGAHTAYLLWSLVPLAVAATALPPARAPIMLIRIVPSAPVAANIVEHAVTSSFDARPWALATWLLGALAMAALTVAQQRRYLRGLGRLTPVGDAPDPSTLRAEATTGCPALVGAWRPRIVVPHDFDTRYAPRERELVLAHERLHRARGDAQANALVVVARCLNWFNPLVHIAAARFRFDQELACDAAVVRRFPEARRCYADAMLKTQLAEQSRQELRLPVGCLWPSGHPLKERIFMLKKPLPSRAGRALGVVLVAALSFGGAYAAWASQSPEADASDISSGIRYEANLKLQLGTGPERLMRLVIPAGRPFTLDAAPNGNVMFGRVTGPAPDDLPAHADAWDAQFVARPTSDRYVEISGTIRHNGKVVASPIVVAALGQPATIMTGEQGGSDSYRLQATLALHDEEAAGAISYHRVRTPIYPASAFDNKVEGIVYVAAVVDTDGRVTSASVDHVEPPIATVLGSVATAAVEGWLFNVPAGGGRVIVPLRFSVADPEAIQPAAMPAGALDIIDVVGRPTS